MYCKILPFITHDFTGLFAFNPPVPEIVKVSMKHFILSKVYTGEGGKE